MVPILFISPDNAIYLYQARVVANVDEWMYGRKTGSLYCPMPEAGTTKSLFNLLFGSLMAQCMFINRYAVM